MAGTLFSPIPDAPDTGWTPPASFPRLESAPLISVDVETKDLGLQSGRGPGWAFEGGGHIVGIAVGVPDGGRWYFPMRHEYGGGNMDPGMVLRWARDNLSGPQPKVGANLAYDVGWLGTEGVTVGGPLIDVQFAAALLDEHRRTYSLDSLSEDYLGAGKVDDALHDWLHRAYGGATGRPQAANIHRAPATLVGPYAEGDVDLPLRLWRVMEPLLEAEGLTELFQMECRLIRILNAMRRRGVRVDTAHAEQVYMELGQEIDSLQRGLDKIAGRPININAASDLAALFDARGVEYTRTPKGAPSFTAGWLKSCDDTAAQMIRDIRELEKVNNTFVKGYILDKHVGGRLHGEFHPLRSDSGGTVSGRMSSSNPNLQNIPSRHPRFGKLVRSMFVPEEGERWLSIDYSQIEYRMFAHYANDMELLRAYSAEDADFHSVAGDMLGGGLPRGIVKNFNFMLLYGGGVGKLADMLREQLTVEDAARLLHETRRTLASG